MQKLFGAICLIAILVNVPAWAQRVSQTAPIPNRTIAAPSAHRPPGGDHPESTAGTIEGFVYWNAHQFSHVPGGSCSGLAVTVAVGSSSGGPLIAYTPLATLTNNFKYVGQVKEFLAGGKVDVYDVCTYGYDHVPVGPDLQVKLAVTQPQVFSPVAVPQVGTVGPIKIINAQCNMLPQITNPGLSDLVAHWGSCQNMAYDVNFVMHTAPRPPLSGGAQTLSGSASTPGEKVPGPTATPLLPGSPQQGILASWANSTAQSPSTNGGLLGNRDQAPAIPDRTRQTYTGTTRSATPQSLTNADVASMLKAGLAESVIISSIRSAKKNFDFSPAGCQTLQRVRASANILVAMGDGSVRPCPAITGNALAATPGGTVELNPQPLPPGSKAAPAGRTALKPIRLAPLKALQRVTNPGLLQQNASIIAVLEQQKLAAQQEVAAMKAGMRSAASAVPSQVPVAARTLQGRAVIRDVGPESTQSEHGNLDSSIVQAHAFNSIVLTCSHDPTPRIIQLSGGQGHGIFTPTAKYNLYTIAGCGFGQSDPGNSAYIFGSNGFKAKLEVDFWSDNGIAAHLDPWLAGVLDQNNVTLVVSPAGKQQIQKPGFMFYAARGLPAPDGSEAEVRLAYNSMPETGVALAYASTPIIAGWNLVPWNAKSQFPSFSFAGTPVIGWVFRYAYGHSDPTNPCFVNDVHYALDICRWYFDQTHVGSDIWDFSKLAPGFVISSYTLYYEETDASQMCGAWDDEASGDRDGLVGKWDFNLKSQNKISVDWPLYYCHDREEVSSRVNKQVQSSYGLAVWVIGPRCVDAWTGQRDQTCMDKVKQVLS